MEFLPIRKQPRLRNFDYSTPGAYFVTICTNERAPFFANERLTHKPVGADPVSARPQGTAQSLYDPSSIAAKMIQDVLHHTVDEFRNVECPYYTIMPDHVHMIWIIKKADNGHIIGGNLRADTGSAPTEGVRAPSIPDVMQCFKRWTTVEYTKLVRQNLAIPYRKHLWQRSYYDHVIRNRDEYYDVIRYIIENPLKLHYHL